MSTVYADDIDGRSRAAYLKSIGVVERRGPRRTPAERAALDLRVQLLLATAENRRRLERIKLAWQNLVDELADGAKRKRAFEGFSREERCLEMLAAMLPDLEQLEVR